MRSAKYGRLHSLAFQLLLTYLGALMLTVVVIAGGLWLLVIRNQDLMTRFDLVNETDLLKESLRFDSSGRAVGLVLPNDASWIYEALPSDLKYRLLDANGRGVLTSDSSTDALAPAGLSFDSGTRLFEIRSGGHRLNVRTVPVVRGATTYYLQAASSDRFAMLARTVGSLLFVRTTLQLVVISMIVFSIVVFFTLRRVLKPLREASEAAARIEPRNLSARIVIRHVPFEFSPVIDAFNQALDRLENGYRVQQAFLEATAHELKTPLALLRAQIEMEGCDDRGTLLRDIDQIARQVHQLLHLAEVSEDRNYRFESTEVAAVAAIVIDYLRRLAERRNVYLDLCCTSAESKSVQADPAALHMLLKNVVENAIEHSPSGGVVAVMVESDQVTIRDEGRGIPEADLPHLFTRYWRGSTRQTEGAGLGLAICKEIVTAHHWHLSARNSGLGAEFVLRFAAEGRSSGDTYAVSPAPPSVAS
jgi:two-component system, OmpR family, sensor histidine kinase QseC